MNSLQILIFMLVFMHESLAKLRVAIINFGTIEPSKYSELANDLRKESVDIVALFPNGPKDSNKLQDELRKNYAVSVKDGPILASSVNFSNMPTRELSTYPLETNDSHSILLGVYETGQEGVSELKNKTPALDQTLLDSQHYLWLISDTKDLHIIYTSGLKKRLTHEGTIAVAGSMAKLAEFDVHNGGWFSLKILIGGLIAVAVVISIIIALFIIRRL